MSEERNDYNQYYDHFPYKSYDEIVAEKRRRRRVRRGCFVLALLLIGMVSLVILIGVWGGKALFSKPNLPKEEEPPSQALPPAGQNKDPEPEGNGEIGSGTLVVPPTVASDQKDDAPTPLVTVRDVSWVVEKSRDSVVGVITESLSDLTQNSAGSGIILTESGYIVTNNHVISGGDSITVVLDNGANYPAYVIGSDEFTDLAVLKIEAGKTLPAAELGDSDALKVGEPAIAIGNPTGQLQGSVTAGIISAVNRNMQVDENMMTLIQTDASINPGNSGGPLLNQYGQVVGITSVKLRSSEYEGLGFAIPIDTVKPIVEELMKYGYVSGRPLAGISGRTISPMAAAFYSLPQGILIDVVEPTSDAASKGVAQGDVLVAVNGTRIANVSEACAVRNQYKAGDSVKLTLYRRGKTYDVSIILMEQANLGGDYNF